MLQVNRTVEEFSYVEDVTELDAKTMIKAREIVDDYVRQGILTNSGFNDDIWFLDNQTQTRALNFSFQTAVLDSYCRKYFKFSAAS